MSLTAEQIEADVMLVVSDILVTPIDKLKLTDEFVKDLGADSLDLVELIVDAEESFHIAISDEEAEKLVTIGSLVDFIKAKVA